MSTAFVSGSDTELSYESFRFALDYIEEKGWEMAGSPVSRIAMMANQNCSYRSLHRVWIPVVGNDVEADDEWSDELITQFVGGLSQ